jgi:4-amino-4-deoxy-L-arabinose transferase-like glycosyltransferase
LSSPTAGLVFILAVYVAIGIQYAALTPAWQVPDEPAHYNYVRHVATTGSFPVLQAGDYDQAYLSELTSEGFPPDKPVDSLRYESHQPPLYYLLAAPVYLATGGALLPLRLFSLALGAGVIVMTYLTVRELFGGAESGLALTAAGFVAFIPQHMAMLAGVNNDSLAELFIGAALLACVALQGNEGNRGNKGKGSGYALRITHYASPITSYQLPLLVGLCFLTKGTAYIVAPVAALAIWLKGRREGRRLSQHLRALAIAFVPALAIGALWWGRNLAVYGWPDWMGLAQHDGVVLGQPRTAEWLAQYGAAEFTRRFIVTTFQSFWGQFGWMGVVMDWRVYAALLAFSLFLLIGLATWMIQWRRGAFDLTPRQRDGLALLATSLALTVAIYLYYNCSLVQHQGR